jgi:hypothetical protein
LTARSVDILADAYHAILLTGKIGAVEQDCKTLQTDDADDTDTVQGNVSDVQMN